MTLKAGNKFFAAGQYNLALQAYEAVVREGGKFADMATFNIKIIKLKLASNPDKYESSQEVSVRIDSDLVHQESHKSLLEEGLLNFDIDFYKQQLYDSHVEHNCSLDVDFFRHFISYGEKNGFTPHPSFSSEEYKQCNPDLSLNDDSSGAFQHFLTTGALERRKYWKNPVTQHHHEFFRFKVLEAKYINWDKLVGKLYAKQFVSIVIPVYGEANLLSECVKSIYLSKSAAQYEVILVDNKKDVATSATIKELACKYDFIKVQNNPFNFNFALGCNTGFAIAKGDVTIFLNTDTQVEDYWLDRLIAPLHNRHIKAVQPKLVYSNAKIQTIGTSLSEWSYMPFEMYKNEPIDSPHVSYSRHFNIITAACMAVKSVDFARVKGFDTQYINGCEDIDLCLKLIDGYKYKCWYESSVTVKHLESKSSGRGKWNEVNRLFFVKRWKDAIKPDASYYFEQDQLFPSYIIDSLKRQKRRIHSCTPSQYSAITQEKIYNSPLLKTCSLSDKNCSSPDFCINSKHVKHNSNVANVMIVGHIAGKNLFGGERSFIDMLEALSKLNVNIIVTLPNSPSIEYRDKILEYALKVYIFSYKWWQPLKAVDRIESQLFYDICRLNSVDVMYVNTIMPCSYKQASDRLNIPVVIHVREFILDDYAFQEKFGISDRNILLSLAERSDYFVANSQATLNIFSEYCNKVLARNVVNTDMFVDLDPPSCLPLRLGMISSNIPKKGIYEFFKLAHLCSTLSNVRFILIGPITEEVKKLQQEYAEFKVNIDVAGYISSPVDAIKKLDIVLSLSCFSESFGRTIAEGFAAKRPAIAFDRGAVNELVIDGETGFLIPPGDINYAAKVINKLSKDTSNVRDLGEKGFMHLQRICSKQQLEVGIAHALIMSKIRINTTDQDLYKRSEEIVRRSHRDLTSVKSLTQILSKKVVIIIPIFNAFSEIQQCIESVLATCLDKHVSLLLVDDCSTDNRVVPYIRSLKKHSCVTVVENKTNLGYTRTINAAIKHAGSADVVLLNSDTIVNNDWLMQLKLAAYSNHSVGTVTPMSNNAGAFSFPRVNENNTIPAKISLEMAARKVLLATKDIDCVSLPTGNGFCMYIKRDLINEIGFFDHKLFPRGYGEENHFCMRAIKANRKNLLCPHAYIFHVKTASFKSERSRLIADGQKALLKAFPSYLQKVKRDFNSSSMLEIRSLVDKVFTTFPL